MSFYEHLAEQSRWNIRSQLKVGDIITFGAAIRSCRVVVNNETGLTLDYGIGALDVWSKRVPPSIQLLHGETEPRLLREA